MSRSSNPHSGLQGDDSASCRQAMSLPAGSRTCFRLFSKILIVGILVFFTVPAIRAQEERGTRLPVVGKIGGTSHQAFNGKVQDVDMKRNLLKVNTVEGSATEFFPIKKNVPVSKANGEKIKVQDLVPGNNIIIYYDQREDRRTISQIIVLASGGEEKEGKAEKEKKKSPPPS